MASQHDRAVTRIANRYGGKHRREGTDLLTDGLTIEVAMGKSDLYQSLKQLKKSRAQKKYIAVPSDLLEDARKVTKGTGIGIMNTAGTIKKRTRSR